MSAGGSRRIRGEAQHIRGSRRLRVGRRNDAMVDETRVKVADFLHAAGPKEIVFGANMTTLNFALSRALASTLSPGDELVVTKMDLTDAPQARDRIAQELGREVLAISAVTGAGIPRLLHAIQERLNERATPADEEAPVESPVAAGGE